MHKLGKIFAFEGFDGTGKSTLCEAVGRKLKGNDTHVFELLSDPGNTDLCKQVKGIILDNNHYDDNEYFLMFLLNRYNLFKESILPKINNGTHVLMDRYIYSSLAYQYTSRLNYKDMLDIHSKLGIQEPELTFYITSSTANISKRLQAKKKCHFEGIMTSKMHDILERFERLYSNSKSWIKIDNNDFKADSADKIAGSILERLNLQC